MLYCNWDIYLINVLVYVMQRTLERRKLEDVVETVGSQCKCVGS